MNQKLLRERAQASSLDMTDLAIKLLDGSDAPDLPPSIWPYSLWNGKNEEGTLVWEIRRDVSGLSLHAEIMSITKHDNYLIINKPESISDEFIDWHIQNASNTSPLGIRQ